MITAAAVLYTIGGVYMKFSAGFTHLVPSLFVYLCFIAGASLQNVAMRQADLGVTYIFVLGMESVLALLFGILLFKESYSLLRLVGISLIVAGMIFLRSGDA